MKPPFRADHVGSLLRPAALQAARAQFAAGEIDTAALAAVEDQQIEAIVRRQQAAGLQAVTDGELRRSWWHLDFLWAFDGIERIVTPSGVAFAGVATRREGLGVTGPIGCSDHPMVEHFRFLSARTRQTAKVTIPAPSALYGRAVAPPIDRNVYPEIGVLFDDLAAAYARVVGEFAAAGCRYLQLDEVFIAMLCDAGYRQAMRERGDDPDALLRLYVKAINTAVAGRPADMCVTLHLCRGNYRSTYMGSGGYEAVDEILFNEVDVDGYFLEFDDERSGGFEPLRFLPRGRKAALGLVTTKRGTLERAEDLLRRIDAAAQFADIDALCLSTQCGFASTEEGNHLSEAEQWAKLERIVEVAARCWG